MAHVPPPVAHIEDYFKALNSNDAFVNLDTFIDSSSAYRSPLLFEAYKDMPQFFKKEKYTKEMIVEFISKYRKAVEVWGPSAVNEKQYLRVYMTHLRRKLERPAGEPRVFETEAGVGYRLCWS